MTVLVYYLLLYGCVELTFGELYVHAWMSGHEGPADGLGVR